MGKSSCESSTAAIKEIILLNKKCADFWLNAHGWAPDDAAALLSKSRLDWQVSLSETLHLWKIKSDQTMSDGELILAWANLGALVEGTLKLYYSVFYVDFANDIETLKYADAWDHKKQKHKPPDGLTLDKLTKFSFKKKLFDAKVFEFLAKVQSSRNVIHAYQDNPLGTVVEFRQAIEDYLALLRSIEGRLPYPYL